ncbi:MAG: Hpt domain-containing protein [Rhodoferax sp.]|nr:Hpt domain-containing protein [Rhodoferax sp.]
MSLPESPASPVYLDTELALSQIGDAETMNGMLLMLQESLARDIPLVSELLAAGDMAGANRVLHALKGFIPIFCDMPLCEQVVRVEGLSKDSQSTAVAPAYRALRPELERLQSEVAAYLKAHAV